MESHCSRADEHGDGALVVDQESDAIAAFDLGLSIVLGVADEAYIQCGLVCDFQSSCYPCDVNGRGKASGRSLKIPRQLALYDAGRCAIVHLSDDGGLAMGFLALYYYSVKTKVGVRRSAIVGFRFDQCCVYYGKVDEEGHS